MQLIHRLWKSFERFRVFQLEIEYEFTVNSNKNEIKTGESLSSTHQLCKWLLEAADLPDKVMVKQPARLGENERVWCVKQPSIYSVYIYMSYRVLSPVTESARDFLAAVVRTHKVNTNKANGVFFSDYVDSKSKGDSGCHWSAHEFVVMHRS